MITALIFFLLITLGLGLPLVLLISPKTNSFVKIGLSFPLGVGIYTLLMFGTNLMGWKFSLPNEIFLLAGVSLPLIIIERKKLRDTFTTFINVRKIASLKSVEKVILGAILLLVVASFINTLYWPVYMWDSVTLYDFRAHVFADTGFMKAALTNEYYYSYPLLTSLAHAIVYLSAGNYPEFLYSAFYFSLGISFYGLLREFVSRKLGLFFTLLLLLTEPIFSHSLYSYTNLTYTVYLGLGVILIYLWAKKRYPGYLILSGLLVGLSTWVRATEPFWIAAVLIILALSIFKRQFWGIALYFLPVWFISKGWKLFQSSVAGSLVPVVGQSDNYLKIWAYLFNFANWLLVFKYLYNHVIASWGLVFVLYVLTFGEVIFHKKNREHLLMFFVVLAFLFVLILGIFIFSIYLDYWYRIGDAIERLSIFFYPLIIYSVALGISKIKDSR